MRFVRLAAIVARDGDRFGRLGLGDVAEGAANAVEDVLASGHERVLHHSRNVCFAIGTMSRIADHAARGPGR